MHDMTPKRFAKAKQETTSPALEVIAHLRKALLNIQPFKLMDGTPVRVAAYQSPEINDEGEAQCGVDVILPNGHLEFTVRNTGWGKSFAKEIAAKQAKWTRHR
ncbi:MAG TPA: hypothetical protein VGN88_10415 [Phycisphaerae bacterium]